MNTQLIRALETAVSDAEDVLALPGATDRRRLNLTPIQRATMAQVLAEHLAGFQSGVRGGPVYLARRFCPKLRKPA